MFTLLFAGPHIFGYDDGRDAENRGPSEHYTMMFNTFVVLQLFNEFNARKLYGEWKVFEGITRNWLFIVIILTILVVQVNFIFCP